MNVGKCPKKKAKLENVPSYFLDFSTPPLVFGHLKPETIEKSDSLRILDTSPSIRSLGARDNRKVGLVMLFNICPRIRSLGARDNRKIGLVLHSGNLP